MERKAYIERLRMLQAFMAVRRAEGVHGIAAGRLVPTRKPIVNWQLLDIESEDNDYGESGVVGTTAWKAVEEEATKSKSLAKKQMWGTGLMCRGCRHWLFKDNAS